MVLRDMKDKTGYLHSAMQIVIYDVKNATRYLMSGMWIPHFRKSCCLHLHGRSTRELFSGPKARVCSMELAVSDFCLILMNL
jgi:hypothetical protein